MRPAAVLSDRSSAATAFREARDRACQYLIRYTRPDGCVGAEERGVADYYKVTWAFQVCGETNRANRLCQWIRKHGITSDGDFGPRPPETRGYGHAYYNAWVVLGAHRLQQYDLSQRGMDFLMGFHDPVSGGFYSSATDRIEDTLQDIWVVSGCGQAALVTGRVDVARGVGRWMKEVMRQQPNFPKQLFGVFSRAEGLHTTPDQDDEIRYVAHQDAQQDQYIFNPGIAGGFLCRLYQTTGESEWLDLAKEYMRFAEGMSDYLFTLLRAGKVGWAASVLYTLTGEDRYADIAQHVGRELLRSQADDGSWSLFDGYQVDMAAEMLVWLDEIQQALGTG